jgi:hypothetical protein
MSGSRNVATKRKITEWLLTPLEHWEAIDIGSTKKCCAIDSPANGIVQYICTRPERHKGPHVGRGITGRFIVWIDDLIIADTRIRNHV